jgi:hypothetical protein
LAPVHHLSELVREAFRLAAEIGDARVVPRHLECLRAERFSDRALFEVRICEE